MLEALIYSGAEAWLATRYRERPHRLYFKVVDIARDVGSARAGLHIVAFRDTSVVRAAVARVFVVGLIGSLLLPMLLVGVTMGLMWRVSRRSGWRWSERLWPHGGFQRKYVRAAEMLSGVLIASLVLFVAGFIDVAVFLTPLLAAVCFVVVYARFPRSEQRHRRNWRWWHTATLILALACIVFVPTTIFVRTSLAHEFGNLVDTERDWIETQRRDSVLDLQAEVRDKNGSVVFAKAVAEGLLRFPNPDPAPFDRPLPDRASRDRWTTVLFKRLDALLPIVSDADARVRTTASRCDTRRPARCESHGRLRPGRRCVWLSCCHCWSPGSVGAGIGSSTQRTRAEPIAGRRRPKSPRGCGLREGMGRLH